MSSQTLRKFGLTLRRFGIGLGPGRVESVSYYRDGLK